MQARIFFFFSAHKLTVTFKGAKEKRNNSHKEGSEGHFRLHCCSFRFLCLSLFGQLYRTKKSPYFVKVGHARGCVSHISFTLLFSSSSLSVNLFGIVRFPNSACGASNGRNGTCYTLAECASRGGANGGACARGFGVCCLCESMYRNTHCCSCSCSGILHLLLLILSLRQCFC